MGHDRGEKIRQIEPCRKQFTHVINFSRELCQESKGLIRRAGELRVEARKVVNISRSVHRPSVGTGDDAEDKAA